MDGDWKRWAAENPEVAARQESEWARDAERKAAERDAETPEQHQTRLAKQNARRRRETPEQREARLAKAREYRQRWCWRRSKGRRDGSRGGGECKTTATGYKALGGSAQNADEANAMELKCPAIP